jgi:endoglucanase
LLLAEAHRLTQETKYLLAAEEVSDYLLGKNGVSTCFVTGFGERSPMNIHHRQSIADGIKEPVPGLLAGGANRGKQDRHRVDYPYKEPAKSYIDDTNSYASNEITVYWNADAVHLFTALNEARH